MRRRIDGGMSREGRSPGSTQWTSLDSLLVRSLPPVG